MTATWKIRMVARPRGTTEKLRAVDLEVEAKNYHDAVLKAAGESGYQDARLIAISMVPDEAQPVNFNSITSAWRMQ